MDARAVGRYLLYEELASGGMASVHLGVQRGDEGFRKAVAVKRLHQQFAKDPDFAAALVDEGRMQARVHHPNVAAALDVVRSRDELLLVMEYVHGASLHELMRACRACGEWPSLPVLAAVVVGTLRGLHAAHEARSTTGSPLEMVHRDVSPQNVLVGTDGVPRVVDFGIAHAAERLQITREGTIKGKPGYMAPEQIRGERPSRTADVYAAGVVLWELLTHERLFPGGDFIVVARAVIDAQVDVPSAIMPGLPAGVDAVVARAIDRDASARYPTAAAFADAIESLGSIASAGEVAAWVNRTAHEILARRAHMLERVERGDLPSDEASGRVRSATMTADVDVSATSADEVRIETSSSAILPARAHARASARRAGPFVALGVVALTAGVVGGVTFGRGAATDASAAAATSAEPRTAAPIASPEPVVTAAPAAPAVSTASSAQTQPPAAPRGKAGVRETRKGPGNEACSIVGPDGIKHWNPRCK